MKATKRILSVLLAVVMVVCAVPVAVGASIVDSGTCGENLTWTLDSEGKLTINGEGDMYSYSYVNGSSTAPWGNQRNRSRIKTVVIGNGVTSIGCLAFYYCDSMTNATIGNSVINIEDSAFMWCKSLTNVTIGNSVVSIGSKVFYECSKLNHIDITDIAAWCNICFDGSLIHFLATKKPYNLYLNGELLTDLIVPNSVTNIGEYAFCDCGSLSSVTIPNSVTSIEDSAFYGCSSLTSVTIPNSVTSIEDSAFYGCSSLTSVTIPNSVTNIGKHVFESCSSLTSVTIPNSVTSISSSMFHLCTSLTSVTIPNSVKSIGIDAFSCCSSLTSITIPNSVYQIGDEAFRSSGLTRVIIPNSVTNIGKSVFSNCSELTSVTIPNNVKIIESFAFSSSGLTSVTIPDSVISIKYSAFEGCSSLTDVYYKGTPEQWGRIIIGRDNDPLKNATLHLYYNPNSDPDPDTGEHFPAGYDDYFCLNIDTNHFFHYAMPYSIESSDYKSKLYRASIMTWNGTLQLYRTLDGHEDGVCHGIAMSMCYGNQGLLDFNEITSGANNYWTLGEPYSNSTFKDILVYYQLLQYSDEGSATKTLDKGGWHPFTPLDQRMQSFFSDLINEAKRSLNEKRPFVFSFTEKDSAGNLSGHSVVVCGYNWNNNTNCHEIKIYDENSYNGSTGTYTTLTIPNNLSSFEFCDANATTGGYTIQDVWDSLRYYGIDQIYNSSYILKAKKSVSTSEAPEKTTLQITKGKKFRLENSSGQWLSFDGDNYSGNMTVYDCYSSGEKNTAFWNLTVDQDNTFILKNAEKDCELIVSVCGKGYAISSDGASSVTISDSGIISNGDEYAISAIVQSETCDAIEIQANATGNIAITEAENTLLIQGIQNDVHAYAYNEAEIHSIHTENGGLNETIINTTLIMPDDNSESGSESQPQGNNTNLCPWCGGEHIGFFAGIIGWFHGILARIFGARY